MRGGVVARTVVDHDDLEVRVVARHERTDCALDADRLVVGGNDDGHGGRVRRCGRSPPCRTEMEASESRDQHDARDEEKTDEADREKEHADEGEAEANRIHENNPALPFPD